MKNLYQFQVFVLILCEFIGFLSLDAQTPQSAEPTGVLCRYPDLHGDKIVYMAGGNGGTFDPKDFEDEKVATKKTVNRRSSK